ncbi:MAG TPA: hypothetical protein DDZ96_01600 [Porphyromonadaceae bacterium]|jgi:RNA polymerase sigma-70 factor (ECF subfamily)|uniref:RNA polymerase sigma factor n=1 Tax=Limibacterium fermenti TaxID=3229863 RepID=UPI000E8AA765|nr:hypothetical protein [Porphyromonadaceae bacterium]HBK33215.1 hypothetical protein [Porphyromonadaceae bacterium]HBL32500.1 hypothetical protein [Porphyromonadaceae bacterium]HBX21595.1 hypothetical protein [Porphyromonadaceae bacterium]HBX46003.1 hypothetical protein [Porphyromonadaceae bacterium]
MKKLVLDSDLLDGISAKDSYAFKEFYIRYASFLFDFVMKKVKSETIAEDITQEFWLNVWEKPSFIHCNGSGSAKSFIVQQLRFRIVDNYRRTLTSPVLWDDMAKAEDMEWYSHVSEDLDVKEAIAIVREALASLPESTRRTFWMRLNNCSPEEIAQTLSITVPTTYNKFSQSLVIVRDHIRNKYPEFAANFVRQSKKPSSSYPLHSATFIWALMELFK